MSYQSESRVPLGPNLRDKREPSRTPTHKYPSSLRIPDDTSWPKIPERRLHENAVSSGGGSKAPCVVSLAKKPLKNRPVQLPQHSQFIRTGGRRDGLDSNSAATRNPTPLQTSANERCITTTTDPKFKTSISTNITNSSDHDAQNDTTGKPVNVFRKTVESRGNPFDKADINNAVASRSLAVINREVGGLANCFRSPTTNNLQELSNLKIATDRQNSAEQDNDRQDLATINDEKKENTAALTSNYNSTPTVQENQDHHVQYLPVAANAAASSRQWTSPAELRPPRSSSSMYSSSVSNSEDTETCCMSSSDAAKIGRAARDRERRVVEGKKKDCDGLQAGRKCCFKASKKVDFDACCCIRCERFLATSKRTPHSEPQIGSRRRRCTTSYGRSSHCCKEVASDSDCRVLATRQQQRLVRRFEDFVSCPDALRALFSKEVALKSRKEKNEVDQFKYACQLAMGAPLTKKRRSDSVVLFAAGGENADSSGDPAFAARDANTATVTAVEKKAPSALSSSATPHSNPPGEKQADTRLFKLKTAVVIGCIVYALALLALPSIYDYFFYEEEEYDEELGFLETILEYIVSSFQEAFAGLADIFDRIFFQSRTCGKCSNSH